MHILRCMGSNFCVKFQRASLKFHTKFWIHTPQNMHFTVLYFCVWVTIFFNCDVISLSDTGPWTHTMKTSGYYLSPENIWKHRMCQIRIPFRLCLNNWFIYQWLWYSISQEICTRFCCALLCCGYAIVHNEFTWSIYPYSSGLLCWNWGNR